MDADRVRRCLEAVDAYRASGMTASEWAVANGLTVRDLASWCGHARRWRAWLAGEELPPRRRSGSGQPRGASGDGFAEVSFSMAEGAGGGAAESAGEIRLDWPLGAGGVVRLHWPMSQARALGAWLRELER